MRLPDAGRPARTYPAGSHPFVRVGDQSDRIIGTATEVVKTGVDPASPVPPSGLCTSGNCSDVPAVRSLDLIAFDPTHDDAGTTVDLIARDLSRPPVPGIQTHISRHGLNTCPVVEFGVLTACFSKTSYSVPTH